VLIRSGGGLRVKGVTLGGGFTQARLRSLVADMISRPVSVLDVRQTIGSAQGDCAERDDTAEAIATRKWLREKIREVRALTRTMR
jgi:hypothetical protein